MLPIPVNLMCMQLHRLHKYFIYAHTVFTKAFEMSYPVLKEVGSPWHSYCNGNIHYTYHLVLLEMFVSLIVLHVRSNLILL